MPKTIRKKTIRKRVNRFIKRQKQRNTKKRCKALRQKEKSRSPLEKLGAPFYYNPNFQFHDLSDDLVIIGIVRLEHPNKDITVKPFKITNKNTFDDHFKENKSSYKKRRLRCLRYCTVPKSKLAGSNIPELV